VIRPEGPDDYAQVGEVLTAAFRGHGPQVAVFVERIRASENYVADLALVSLDDTGVIGHVMLSFVGIEGGAREQLLCLTPMSVRPDRQLQGVGRALIDEVLARADAAGEPAVLLEGIPDYYPRFGFELAGAHGFEHPNPEMPAEAFMVKRLSTWDASLAGRIVYPPYYDVL
jgi:putative acetyltransferase